MDTVIKCFAVVGVVVVAFALVILIINGISFLITTIKNAKTQVKIANENNQLLAEAKRERLAKARAQTIEIKNRKLERKLAKKKKKADFEDKKDEMQQKIADKKNDKYLSKLSAKTGEAYIPTIEDDKEDEELTKEFIEQVETNEENQENQDA